MIKMALAVGLALIVAPVAGHAGGPPCVQKEFKTVMIKAACEAGGQDEAKAQMAAFVAKHGSQGKKLTKTAIFTCNACHEKLDPNFERKPTALDLYKQLGGK